MVEKKFVVSSKSLLPCKEILYILGALWWGMQGKGQLLCVLQVAVEVRLGYSPPSISAILSYLCLRDKMTIHSESHLYRLLLFRMLSEVLPLLFNSSHTETVNILRAWGVHEQWMRAMERTKASPYLKFVSYQSGAMRLLCWHQEVMV